MKIFLVAFLMYYRSTVSSMSAKTDISSAVSYSSHFIDKNANLPSLKRL